MKNPFERISHRKIEEDERELLESLKEIEGAEIALAESWTKHHYRLQFRDNEAVVSVFIHFFDESGADIAITAMTNLSIDTKIKSESFRGQGRGSEALQKIISWAKSHNYHHIIAVQVQGPARDFWRKNGFVYDEREDNVSEDWIYVGEEREE